MIGLKYPFILGSKSPRRQQLLQELGIDFTIQFIETDESWPKSLKPEAAARFLAEKKARAFLPLLTHEILLTADTLVAVKDRVFGKPADAVEAEIMLRKLSGREHEVITGICILHDGIFHTDSDITKVFFRNLEEREIDYYIRHYMPLDKAGAYGIQEWIGMIGIDRIEGSFFNVVGLPVTKLYMMLKKLDLIST